MNPKVFYLDEAGNPRSCELEPLTIKVEEVILPDRISTGLKELDSLLLGGIPERYAVVLTASSSDERDSVIKSFLETGVREGQITFHVTGEATDLESLAESFQSNFFLFLCNIKAHSRFPALPNVHKLLGTTNLTNLNIALTKAYRTLDKSLKGSRRACIEIVSDVLLLHKAVVTRRWLSEAISDLRSKGFTTMTVMNPLMHPPDQVHAILGLFDGEISIDDVETRRGIEKLLRIKKLRNKRYVENPIPLKRKQV